MSSPTYGGFLGNRDWMNQGQDNPSPRAEAQKDFSDAFSGGGVNSYFERQQQPAQQYQQPAQPQQYQQPQNFNPNAPQQQPQPQYQQPMQPNQQQYQAPKTSADYKREAMDAQTKLDEIIKKLEDGTAYRKPDGTLDSEMYRRDSAAKDRLNSQLVIASQNAISAEMKELTASQQRQQQPNVSQNMVRSEANEMLVFLDNQQDELRRQGRSSVPPELQQAFRQEYINIFRQLEANGEFNKPEYQDQNKRYGMLELAYNTAVGRVINGQAMPQGMQQPNTFQGNYGQQAVGYQPVYNQQMPMQQAAQGQQMPLQPNGLVHEIAKDYITSNMGRNLSIAEQKRQKLGQQQQQVINNMNDQANNWQQAQQRQQPTGAMPPQDDQVARFNMYLQDAQRKNAMRRQNELMRAGVIQNGQQF